MPTQQEARQSAPRLPFIDGLRGIAVAMVVCFHAVVWGGFPTSDEGRHYLFDGAVPIELGLLRQIASLGGVGVDIFLAISGFCLFWPLIKKGDGRAEPLNVRQYIKRRAWRICPPYYFGLATVFLCSYLTYQFEGMSWWPWKPASFQNAFPWQGSDSFLNLGSHLLLIHGFFNSYINAYEGAYWSLSTEWQLYFLFIPLAFIARRFGVLWAIAVPVIFTIVFRYACTIFFPSFLLTPVGVSLSLSRWVEFGAGMLAAAIVSGSLSPRIKESFQPLQRLQLLYIIGSVAAAAIIEYMGELPHTRPFLWGNASLALLTIGTQSGGWLHRVMEWRPLVWLGKVSYSLYLTHGMVYMAMALILSRVTVSRDVRQLIYLLLGPAIAVAFSALFFRCFEQPFLSGRTVRRTDNQQLEAHYTATVQDQAIP